MSNSEWVKDSNIITDDGWGKSNPTPFNPWDNLSQDQLLVRHEQLKIKLEDAKADEMALRRYIVKRAFPKPNEGMNTLELGNGYELKATVKYNYKLKAPENFDGDVVQAVDDCVDAFAQALPNEGPFIADRLFKYSVDISIAEYRKLQEEAMSFPSKKKLLDLVSNILEITDAAPTLAIKAPKEKK